LLRRAGLKSAGSGRRGCKCKKKHEGRQDFHPKWARALWPSVLGAAAQ
jgi:hypothetical protein